MRIQDTSRDGQKSTGSAYGMLSLPPTFPRGVDPETYRQEEVTALLKAAAYFPLFSVANPDSPNKPILLIPGISFLMTAVEVNEQLHRFEIKVEPPTLPRGLRASDHVGETVAHVHIRWTPMPENFVPDPDTIPPPTVLNPFCSQRFTTLDGLFTFEDQDQSGFKGFGAGRTFPAWEVGSRLRIGAVVTMREGLGKFQGLSGTIVINGYIEPPRGLALNITARLMDPTGQLKAMSALTPLQELPDPDPNAVFVFFLSEPDPDKPMTLNLASDGRRILGLQVHEVLRPVHIGFDLHTSAGLRSQTTPGPIIGSVSSTLFLNPWDPRPVFPIQTTNGVFTFLDRERNVIGTVQVNMSEGRAFRTDLDGAPMPVFRYGGFGPILGGTGQFSRASGMMSVNAALSVFPYTLSNLYIFRFYDPGHKLHDALHPGRS